MADNLTNELLKRSWADPKNRPPRDTSAKVQHPALPSPYDRISQRLSVEGTIDVPQPRFNIVPDGGLPKDLDGSLSVVTDPQALVRHILEHPEFYQDDIDDLKDNPDEDAADNTDQSPEESLMRQLLNRLQGGQ